jgi:hypothetical protein
MIPTAGDTRGRKPVEKLRRARFHTVSSGRQRCFGLVAQAGVLSRACAADVPVGESYTRDFSEPGRVLTSAQANRVSHGITGRKRKFGLSSRTSPQLQSDALLFSCEGFVRQAQLERALALGALCVGDLELRALLVDVLQSP